MELHRERERIDDGDNGEMPSDIDEEHAENFVGELNMKFGQALCVTKQVPIYCRMTALLLTR